MQRKNEYFDFGALRDALLKEGWDKLVQFDSITLMNDTCFGPLFPMDEVYKKMEKSGTDFLGITNHRATNGVNKRSKMQFLEHIQSYFMVFNKNVVQSETFRNFWEHVDDHVGC